MSSDNIDRSGGTETAGEAGDQVATTGPAPLPEAAAARLAALRKSLRRVAVTTVVLTALVAASDFSLMSGLSRLVIAALLLLAGSAPRALARPGRRWAAREASNSRLPSTTRHLMVLLVFSQFPVLVAVVTATL